MINYDYIIQLFNIPNVWFSTI